MAYERICCPLCKETFGQEVKFIAHLSMMHHVSDHFALYLDTYHEGKHPTCNCVAECRDKLAWSGWKKGFVSKYVRGHNARVDSVYLNPEKQKEMAKKRVEGYAEGRYHPWNKGLSKETSDKVAQASSLISKTLHDGYVTGRLEDWRKTFPEKAAVVVSKMSETKKRLYSSGELVPWNLGMTKSSSQSVAKSSDSIKKNYEMNPDASAKRYRPDQVISIIEDTGKFDLIDDPTLYRNKYQKMRLRCKTCDQIQLKNMMMIAASPVCFSCSPKESKGQLEVYDFTKTLASDAILSDRKLISPREIDILVPSIRLAIEYNGLYWHSAANIADKNYHEFKRRAVEQTGHKFLMIFEDEWRDKRSVVESMIGHRLNIYLERLDARKLKIEEIDAKTAELFFEMSHLEGHARSSSCLGLVDGTGRIVAAMSLRRPFHASRAATHVEVARSACLPGVAIRGWIGRLTSASLKKVRSSGTASLVSYVDSRVGDGRSYLSSGWRLESSPKIPRFWWTDFHNRYNRFKYRANKSLGMSQTEIAAREGVVEIWGCSNYVMVID